MLVRLQQKPGTGPALSKYTAPLETGSDADLGSDFEDLPGVDIEDMLRAEPFCTGGYERLSRMRRDRTILVSSIACLSRLTSAYTGMDLGKLAYRDFDCIDCRIPLYPL